MDTIYLDTIYDDNLFFSVYFDEVTRSHPSENCLDEKVIVIQEGGALTNLPKMSLQFWERNLSQYPHIQEARQATTWRELTPKGYPNIQALPPEF